MALVEYVNNIMDDISNLPNQEQIASRRISLEEAGVQQSNRASWTCHYCNRRFKSELMFMKHECQEKRRQEQLRSPIGQAAYAYYNEWMRLRKFSIQSSSTFLTSKYYLQMIRFAELVQRANINNPLKYIELMVSNDLQPALWCSNGAYTLFLEWSDQREDPIDQVGASIEHLISLAEADGIELSNIFDHLGSQKVLALIRQRKLSPWLCFNSVKFGALLHSISTEERAAYGAAINSAAWAERFNSQRAALASVKEIVAGIGL